MCKIKGTRPQVYLWIFVSELLDTHHICRKHRQSSENVQSSPKGSGMYVTTLDHSPLITCMIQHRFKAHAAFKIENLAGSWSNN